MNNTSTSCPPFTHPSTMPATTSYKNRILRSQLFWIILIASSLPSPAKNKQQWPNEVSTVTHPSSLDQQQQPMMVYASKSKEKRPLLVALHTWSSRYDQKGGETVYARWCIENDWHFVHPHFRGPNNSPKTMGSEFVIQDIIDAVDYMKKNNHIDSDRIYLVGASGGGYAALLMAGRAPHLWAGVSAWVPISDIHTWWKQKIDDPRNRKYAQNIENSVGGPPETNRHFADECHNRSANTYLKKAVNVNLDINAGVKDGHRGGSVPFTHSLYAFNAVVPDADKIDAQLIESFYRTQSLPDGLQPAEPDSLYGKKKVIFRKISNNTRVSIFEGGHDIIHKASLNWLAQQRKGSSAQWKITKIKELETAQKEGDSGK